MKTSYGVIAIAAGIGLAIALKTRANWLDSANDAEKMAPPKKPVCEVPMMKSSAEKSQESTPAPPESTTVASTVDSLASAPTPPMASTASFTEDPNSTPPADRELPSQPVPHSTEEHTADDVDGVNSQSDVPGADDRREQKPRAISIVATPESPPLSPVNSTPASSTWASPNSKKERFVLKVKVKCCMFEKVDPLNRLFPDCYVIFNVVDKSRTKVRWTEETRVVKPSETPVWNQAFSVPKIVQEDDILVFTLVQKRTILSNDLLGQCVFKLSTLAGTEGGDYSLFLTPVVLPPVDLRGGYAGRRKSQMAELIEKNKAEKKTNNSNVRISFEVLVVKDATPQQSRDMRLNTLMQSSDTDGVGDSVLFNMTRLNGTKDNVVPSDI